MTSRPDLAETLDRFINAAHLSNDRLAQLSDVPKSTIVNWRTAIAKRPQQWQGLARVAAALELNAAQTDELLVSAGHPTLSDLAERDLVLEDRSLLRHWSPDEIGEEQGSEKVEPTVGVTGEDCEKPRSVGEVNKPTKPQPTMLPRIGGSRWVVVPVLLLLLVGLFVTAKRIIWPRFSPSPRSFVIAEWESRAVDSTAAEAMLVTSIRDNLYANLNQIHGLQGLARQSPQVSDEQLAQADYWIEGSFQRVGKEVRLTATAYGLGGVLVDTVYVEGEIDPTHAEREICTLELQVELAQKLLSVLGFQTVDRFEPLNMGMPTMDCEAVYLNNYAVARIEDGDYHSAHSLLEQALVVDPDYADAYNNLGQLYAAQYQWQASIPHYQRALELGPDNPIYHYNLGGAYERLQRYDEAVIAYQAAIERDRLSFWAWNNLGVTYLLMGALDKAEEALRIGLGITPDDPYLYKNIGRIHLERGEPDDAIPALRKAITLYPNARFPEAYFHLVSAYIQLNQTDEACATLMAYFSNLESTGDNEELERVLQAERWANELKCQTRG